MNSGRAKRWIGLFVASSVICAPFTAFADDSIKEQVDVLSGEVKQKQDRVKELDSLIGAYRSRITDQESKQASLENEVALLDNRIREKELTIQRDKTELDSLTTQILQLDLQIKDQEQHVVTQKQLIASLIREQRQADGVSMLDVLLSNPSLSSFFAKVEALKRVQKDLSSSMNRLKETTATLVQSQQARDARRKEIAKEQDQLKTEQDQLLGERNFKTSLVSETQQSQEEFSKILYELQQQQQVTADDISRLETQLKSTLDTVDESLARGDILLNWPIKPQQGISAHFHDPTYPFRNLFAHPGTDIPTPVGTPIHAAAGGYVAWTKTGKSYGNYLMIVHPGGIATIYAHLTKFVAKPDTYVDRGDIIGLSGGQPGMQGAGLSTGPHLHFEVRQNGIPVNAENFLPSL